MANFILILFCISAGFIASRSGALPRDSFKAINAWVIYFGMPAIVIRYLPTIHWNVDMLLPALCPLVVWFGSALYVRILSRLRTLDKETRAVITVSCGLGNTGFFGYPAIIAFYGNEALSVGIVSDIVTTITFSIFGVALILKAASQDGDGKHTDYRKLLKRIFTFPVFTTALIVLPLSAVLDFSPIFPFVDLIVPTVAPLALFSIGLQFEFKDSGKSMGFVLNSMLYKLLLAPALVLLLALAAGVHGEPAMISVLEAGMPAHVMGCVTASQFNLNPRLCALLVAVTIIGALVVLPLWYLALQLIF